MLFGDLIRAVKTAPRRLGLEAIFVVVGMAVSVVGQAAILKLITTCLTRTSYGLYALGNSALGLVQSVAFGSLFVAMGRLAPDFARSGTVSRLVQHVAALSRRPSYVIVLVTLLVAAGFFITGHANVISLTIAFLILLFSANRSLRTTSLEQATRLRGTLVLHSSTELVARATLAALFLHFVPRPDAVVLALALACFGTNMLFQRRVLKRLAIGVTDPPPVDVIGERRRLVQYWYPVAVATTLAWLYTNADRWVIEHFESVDATALYAGAAQLAALPFTMLAGLITNFASPILYARASLDPVGTRRVVYVTVVLYALPATIGWFLISMLSRSLVRLFLGANLWDCAPLVPVIAAGWALIQLSGLLHVGILASGRATRLILPNVATAAAALLATVSLVRIYGSVGAGLALIITGVVRLILMALTFVLVKPTTAITTSP